eukprot:Gb_19307 [translate_table: standard]
MRVPAMADEDHRSSLMSDGFSCSEEKVCNYPTCQSTDWIVYIRLVQHLIEKCLLLGMDRNDCVDAIAKYANIHPAVTRTVWRELLKENKDFFTAYFIHRSDANRIRHSFGNGDVRHDLKFTRRK